jgi:hypothetical protein
MIPDEQLISEAKIFCRYLLNKKADEHAISLYCEAIQKTNIQLTEKDQRILRFILNVPFCIGFIDAAQALSYKDSPVRKRLFVMLAVLETIPEYYSCFASKQRSLWFLFVIAAHGFRAVYRYCFGIVLIKFL